jgi:hypothetical protein
MEATKRPPPAETRRELLLETLASFVPDADLWAFAGKADFDQVDPRPCSPCVFLLVGKDTCWAPGREGLVLTSPELASKDAFCTKRCAVQDFELDGAADLLRAGLVEAARHGLGSSSTPLRALLHHFEKTNVDGEDEDDTFFLSAKLVIAGAEESLEFTLEARSGYRARLHAPWAIHDEWSPYALGSPLSLRCLTAPPWRRRITRERLLGRHATLHVSVEGELVESFEGTLSLSSRAEVCKVKLRDGSSAEVLGFPTPEGRSVLLKDGKRLSVGFEELRGSTVRVSPKPFPGEGQLVAIFGLDSRECGVGRSGPWPPSDEDRGTALAGAMWSHELNGELGMVLKPAFGGIPALV